MLRATRRCPRACAILIPLAGCWGDLPYSDGFPASDTGVHGQETGIDDSCADRDGDGFVVPLDESGCADGLRIDCDDNEPDSFPGAPDQWYDGVDSDCAGDDDFDQDGDGFVSIEHVGQTTAGVQASGDLPGGDCDDTNADVHPLASEVCGNGVDDDCDGTVNDCPFGEESITDRAAAIWIGETDLLHAHLADISGDGQADIIMDATSIDSNRGAIWIGEDPLNGGVAGVDTQVTLTADSENDTLLVGAVADLNADGQVDLVATARGWDSPGDSGAGAAFILFGPVTTSPGVLGPANVAATVYGSDVDDQLGGGVTAVVDNVTGDGNPDLVLVAPTADLSTEADVGTVYILGTTPEFLGSAESQATAIRHGGAAGTRLTYAASAGDVDGDGVGDLLVGTEAFDGSGSYTGQVYLELGPLTGTFRVGEPARSVTYTGAYSGARLGLVSTGGDYNDDGYDDLVLSSRGHADDWGNEGAGRIFSVVGEPTLDNALAIDAAAVVLTGEGDSALGTSAQLVDFDCDGNLDIVTTAIRAGDHDTDNTGAVVWFAGPLEAGGRDLDEANGLLTGQATNDYLGTLGTFADVHGSGCNDLVVTSTFARSGRGEAYIVPGGGL